MAIRDRTTDTLRDEIAREVEAQGWQRGGYNMVQSPPADDSYLTADRILAIPRLQEALKNLDEMDALFLPPLTNEQMRELLDKVTLGHSISTNTKG